MNASAYNAWIHRRRDATPEPAGDPACDLCGGDGWVAVPDELFGGALVDQRCPACCDTTVRARKRRWEDNQGRTVGPR